MERRTGLRVEVISGADEARLAYLAAHNSLSLESERLAIVDVGGGSTELIFGSEGGVERVLSLEVGALVATERIIRSDPVASEELAALGRHVEEALALSGSEAVARLVGIGGAITTLAAVAQSLERYEPERIHGAILSLEEVRRQVALYAGRSVAERRVLAGLHPRRADIILAGAVITARVMERLGVEQVTVCERGIRHGLLVERFTTRS
jgi:exopolyphosphatase/guanosine-5'-triphosphate,3'-diphosphate pyrophosphatase